MTDRRWMFSLSVAVALLAGTWGMGSPSAQAPGFKRVELQRHDLTAAGKEAVVARAEFDAGAAAPKHTHPGEELAYVLQGELSVEIEGKPAVKLKAGDVFFVPAGAVHSARNTAKGATVVLSTYVIEKGKPLATPVK